MEQIKVGEYIRTKNGIIAKLDYIEIRNVENIYYFDKVIYRRYDDDFDFLVSKNLFEYIVKHSPNIIDLIEEGDYVNGYEIIEVYGYDEDGNDKDGIGICEVDDDYAYYIYLEDLDIKTIVTKELMESIKYEVSK